MRGGKKWKNYSLLEEEAPKTNTECTMGKVDAKRAVYSTG